MITRVLCVALCIVPAVQSSTQRARAGGLTYVSQAGPGATVVLVDSLPSWEKRYVAVILRRSREEPHDVIVLTRVALTPGLLDTAIRTLLNMRARQGDQQNTYQGRSYRTLTV